ncbi:hypothetical protein LWC34_54730 [Kibdelosporangium philippinense]|uniref:DUF2637 domain-containing protein n=1 Tax=Kibdelosporangium philippinense TaxID=211113 RepID=A0ABS8ZY98_9PSEU|nr:hypothetical protein [Kibdelosporangium philippinense]MCE7011816.1 hypothetical protein [Kibdelosporangium philippinense]
MATPTPRPQAYLTNVLNLALRLGVPIWVAPLVAPAVDLSILGLLLGTRYLALRGATLTQLRPARRLLNFASLATLALNVADPIVAGEYGKAAFDAVGPLLLIGWAEVGPGFLQAISATSPQAHEPDTEREVHVRQSIPGSDEGKVSLGETVTSTRAVKRTTRTSSEAHSAGIPNDLLERARQEDAIHRAVHQRPISADTLRRQLGIGAKRARRLVALVRSEAQVQATVELAKDEIGSDGNGSGVTLAA